MDITDGSRVPFHAGVGRIVFTILVTKDFILKLDLRSHDDSSVWSNVSSHKLTYFRPSSALIVVYRKCLLFRNTRACWFHVHRTDRRARKVNNTFVLLLLLISGVESNPGPGRPMNFGMLNGRSIANKGALVQDLIISGELDLLAVSETWIPSDAPDPILHGCVPPGYRIHHVHRGDHTAVGGGLAVIHRNDFKVKQSTQQTRYKSFECQMVTVTNVKPPLTIANIYRPPTSGTEEFSDEFGAFMSNTLISCKRLLICGDFNCPWAPGSDVNSTISSFVQTFGLRQYIEVSTHARGNILDLMFDQGLPDFISDINVSSVSFSDHFLVRCTLNTGRRNVVVKEIRSRNFKRFNADVFTHRLRESDIFNNLLNR